MSSFDDLPTQSHVISSSNKHRAALPNKRRPPARHKPAVTTGNRPDLYNNNAYMRDA